MTNGCDLVRQHADKFGEPDEYETERSKRGVLIAFDSIPKITRALGQAGVAKSTHYSQMRRDPQYKAQILTMTKAA